jgi:hypothetical protein
MRGMDMGNMPMSSARGRPAIVAGDCCHGPSSTTAMKELNGPFAGGGIDSRCTSAINQRAEWVALPVSKQAPDSL